MTLLDKASAIIALVLGAYGTFVDSVPFGLFAITIMVGLVAKAALS